MHQLIIFKKSNIITPGGAWRGRRCVIAGFETQKQVCMSSNASGLKIILGISNEMRQCGASPLAPELVNEAARLGKKGGAVVGLNGK